MRSVKGGEVILRRRSQVDTLLSAIFCRRRPCDEAGADEILDQPTRGRRRPVDRVGDLADRRPATAGDDVQCDELREGQVASIETLQSGYERVSGERRFAVVIHEGSVWVARD